MRIMKLMLRWTPRLRLKSFKRKKWLKIRKRPKSICLNQGPVIQITGATATVDHVVAQKGVHRTTWLQLIPATTSSGKLWRHTSQPTALSDSAQGPKMSVTLRYSAQEMTQAQIWRASSHADELLASKVKNSDSQTMSSAPTVSYPSPRRFQMKNQSTNAQTL